MSPERGRPPPRSGRRRAPSRWAPEASPLYERRAAGRPPLRFPDGLPVVERREEILAAIRQHQVVVVAGETGSGKTTQLPKLCLEAGLGIRGMIGHTQPRRIAARTVAERIAEELDVELGGAIGYAVRFDDQVGPDTLVKVMTDGILLAELQRDPELSAYEVIIVDEAHERSLNIDFILGYLRSLLPRRPELKVVITSATIDTERFSAHFDRAPVIEVSGRTYPVEIRYRPADDDAPADGEETEDLVRRRARDSDAKDQIQRIGEAVEELMAEGPGDVLVFLSGEREIRDTAEALRRLELVDTEVVPLYARLSAAEQHRVFQAHRIRRVVLATNVAETSITVPGIRYVVDTGVARISRYNRRTKVQRLPIEAVSQASANQRAGRCGRLGPGVCIRLYSEEDFRSRPEFTDPEILRTNLAAVILQMAAIGLGEVATFPFVDPPDSRQVKDGVALLEELGALDPTATDPRRRLTALGRRLAQLPVDPRLGRMVLEADRQGALREVMVIAAALSIQDPRERPSDQAQAAAEAHGRFVDASSDFITLLNLWAYLQERQRELSGNQFRRLCRREFLNYQRIREWQDIGSQLRQVGRELGLRPNSQPAPVDLVHRCLLAGLLSHIGLRDPERRDYLGGHNARFAVGAGSALAKGNARWVMAAELVETNRLWARTVARIRPEWAEALGAHLVKRSYGDPEWDPDRGAAVVLERVTLYGLPIVAARRVPYGRVDPAGARQMFIRHALVEGDWRTHHRFAAHNQELVEEVNRLEVRSRRAHLMVGVDEIEEFFDQRLPDKITSGAAFDRWWNQEKANDPHLLDFSLSLLVGPGQGAVDPADFPDQWEQGPVTVDLSYETDPASPTDGVSVHVPVAVLGGLRADGFDWHVPGLRSELVSTLIRLLPKAARRQLVPAGEHAGRFLSAHSPEEGPLLVVLAAELSRWAGQPVSPSDWDLTRLPGYLRVTFVAEDAQGRRLDYDKDLEALRHRMAGRARRALSAAIAGYERDGLTTWDLAALPRVVEKEWQGQPVRGYPALLDAGSSVSVRLYTTPGEADLAMWRGTRRLLLLNTPGRAVALRSLDNRTRLSISQSPYDSVRDLLDDCAEVTMDELLEVAGGPVWDEEAFRALLATVRARFGPDLQKRIRLVGAILDDWRAVQARLERAGSNLIAPAVADMRTQLAELVHPGFVGAAGSHLDDLPRYLAGIGRRLDRVAEAPQRDARDMAQVHQLSARLRAAAAAGASAVAVRRVRWLLEELRISYFAQVLGTPEPVSAERIRRTLDTLGGAA